MKVLSGDILTFRGVAWNDGWEFGAPLIIYEPIKRYFDSNSVSAISIVDKAEDIAIDLCVASRRREVNADWHPGDLKEFAWRGWSIKGFRKRKNACHAEATIRFKIDPDGGLGFDLVAAASIDIATGRLTPVLDGVPATMREKKTASKR